MLCDEVKRAVYFYLDGALDDRRNDDFRTHLDDCPGCDQRMLVHRRMREFVRHRLAQITAPERFKVRLTRSLRAMAD